MKRTLVEVFCGLAALVLMVSFHHQIARLERQQHDVTEIEQKLADVTKVMTDTSQIEAVRHEILSETEARMQRLEVQLQNAAAGSTHAQRLESELKAAKCEVETFRSQLSSDFARTKELVDAYIREVRSKEHDAALRLDETQGAIATIASSIHRDPSLLTETMLLPTVQLNGDDTVGSGTLVFSDKNPKTGECESYVLTSYHVVRNILADTPRAAKEGFDATIYLPGERLTVKGRMVASRAKIDAALVKLETDRKLPFVANVIARDETMERVKVWEPVTAVGCPLGNDPVPSSGQVSSLKNELNGSNYWMINAPTYFGNSGGGIYLADTHQLIGVFSKIYTHGKGNPVVVPHMGLCTPIDLVYDWLAEEKLTHLLRSQSVAPIDLGALAAPMK
ncbi:MAG: trypsin-like peptidase domain-containing protein [Planctomycetes bacterium]|nr:trypsin-like peptidase domain-containing protein [Planctomycetota bacterium]